MAKIDAPMKIAVISKDDTRGGGASVVADQLSIEYRKLGHDADHMHLNSLNLHPYGRLAKPITFTKRVEGKMGV